MRLDNAEGSIGSDHLVVLQVLVVPFWFMALTLTGFWRPSLHLKSSLSLLC